MNISEDVLSTGSSLASQVHAAAVNGDKGALQRLIVGKQSPVNLDAVSDWRNGLFGKVVCRTSMRT
jgi:hypothetical protein